MKRILIVTILYICSVNLFAQTQSSQFVISGKIAGIKDGTEVQLVSLEDNKYKGTELISTKVKNGIFELKGKVSSPTFCRIEVINEYCDSDGVNNKTQTCIPVIVENDTYVVEAAHIDSIPLTWEFGKSPLQKEKNVYVRGGKAQAEYYESRNRLHQLELQEWIYGRKILDFKTGKKSNADSLKYYSDKNREYQQQITKAIDLFIEEHPAYAISVHFNKEKASTLFCYTSAELDEMVKQVENTYDVVRLDKFKKQVEQTKKFAKGLSYVDFEVSSETQNKKILSENIESGTYNLIDFWASWCGPCRASIPHLKELKNQYGNKLNIISVSLDKSESDWMKAVKAENMPWSQVMVTKVGSSKMTEAYQLRSIPYMVIVDPAGKIEFATHSADEISIKLEKLLN